MLDLWVDRAIDLNVLDDVLDFWNHGKIHDVSCVRRCGNGAEWAVACSNLNVWVNSSPMWLADALLDDIIVSS